MATDDNVSVNADALRAAEYCICQRRGHQPSEITLASNPPWNVCKWCGTNYRFEQTLVEGHNRPADDENT